ncbi:MAG: alpha/beta hydrolase [Bacteroidota bacterium]
MKRVILSILICLGFLFGVGAKAQQAGKSFEVNVTKDIRYHQGLPSDSDKHSLDLYLPVGQKDYPIMIWIHGGAWAFGDKSNEADLAKSFASRGIGVACINHRISPATWRDAKYNKGIEHPEHIRDVARAFKWVYDHASQYDYRRSSVFVSGYSSGGHLAALLAMDSQYLEDLGLHTEHIRGAIPLAGAYDIPAYYDVHLRHNGPELANGHVKGVFGQTREELQKASPTTYIGKTNVTMLVMSESQSYQYTKIFEDKVQAVGATNIQFYHISDYDHRGFYQHLAKSADSQYRDMIIDFIFEAHNL